MIGLFLRERGFRSVVTCMFWRRILEKLCFRRSKFAYTCAAWRRRASHAAFVVMEMERPPPCGAAPSPRPHEPLAAVERRAVEESDREGGVVLPPSLSGQRNGARDSSDASDASLEALRARASGAHPPVTAGVSAAEFAGIYCHPGLGCLACSCVNARSAETLVTCGCVVGLITMPLCESHSMSGLRRFSTDSNTCGSSETVEFREQGMSCARGEVCWTYRFLSCMSFVGPGVQLLSFKPCARDAIRAREERVQRIEQSEAAAASEAPGSASATVTTLTGDPVSVRFEVGEEITFFKQRIAGLIGIPVLNQRLVCDGHELRRGTMTAACAGALVNLIVVLREEGERAAAEDSHLERDERGGGSSRCCCATARTRRPGDARGDPGESVCTPVDCS